MEIVKQDVLDLNSPALSSTNDIPIVETKPDSTPAPKPEEKIPEPTAPEEKAAPAAEEKSEEPAPSEQPDDPSAEPEPKKAKGVQKRIDELLAREREAIRRAEAADARLDRALSALEKQGKEIQTESNNTGPEKPAFDPNNPEASIASLEQYIKERTEWVADQKVKATLAEEEKKRRDAQFADQLRQTQETYKQRVEKAKEKFPDYTEVAESPDVKVSMVLANAIARSDDGPEIAYFLGKHPAEAKRISEMMTVDQQGQAIPDAFRQLVELGKISAKLSTPAEKPKPISAAPAPGKLTKPSSETQPSPEEESMEAYASRRKKELAEGNRRGVRH